MEELVDYAKEGRLLFLHLNLLLPGLLLLLAQGFCCSLSSCNRAVVVPASSMPPSPHSFTSPFDMMLLGL